VYRKQGKYKSKELNIELFSRVKADEMAVFTRQLATMVSSGMTILRALHVLETQTDFEIVGSPEQAASGEEALRLVLETQPDILLLDLEMPGMDGVETIRQLRSQNRQIGMGMPQGTVQRPRIIVAQPGNVQLGQPGHIDARIAGRHDTPRRVAHQRRGEDTAAAASASDITTPLKCRSPRRIVLMMYGENAARWLGSIRSYVANETMTNGTPLLTAALNGARSCWGFSRCVIRPRPMRARTPARWHSSM